MLCSDTGAPYEASLNREKVAPLKAVQDGSDARRGAPNVLGLYGLPSRPLGA